MTTLSNVTSGFFNSTSTNPKKYNAKEFGSIFDGIINDGVYSTIGDKLMVSVHPTNTNAVLVGSGRGWFYHSWVLNPASQTLVCNDPLNGSQDRYDAVVIDCDHRATNGNNNIICISGSYAANPQKPTVGKIGEDHWYIPLAYIRRRHGQPILASDIENCVGTSECPFVLGVVETMTIEQFTAQWGSEWEQFLNETNDQLDTVVNEFNEDSTKAIDDFTETSTEDFNEFMYDTKMEIEEWLNGLYDYLSPDAEIKIGMELSALKMKLDNLIKNKYTYDEVLTRPSGSEDTEPLTDHEGNDIYGIVYFGCSCG